jgi:hypothetical protein
MANNDQNKKVYAKDIRPIPGSVFKKKAGVVKIGGESYEGTGLRAYVLKKALGGITPRQLEEHLKKQGVGFKQLDKRRSIIGLVSKDGDQAAQKELAARQQRIKNRNFAAYKTARDEEDKQMGGYGDQLKARRSKGFIKKSYEEENSSRLGTAGAQYKVGINTRQFSTEDMRRGKDKVASALNSKTDVASTALGGSRASKLAGGRLDNGPTSPLTQPPDLKAGKGFINMPRKGLL